MMSNSNSSQDDSIDIGDVLRLLWKNKWPISTTTFITAAAVCAIAFWMTPIYRASTVLVSASEDRRSTGSIGSVLGQFGGLASLAGISLSSGASEMEEALAVFKSRQFLDKFIAEKNLLPVIFPQRWDAVHHVWKGVETDQPAAGDGYRYFTKKIITITQDKKTNLVTLMVDWRDRQQAADWANDLVRRINLEMRARAKEKADASVKYLQSELNVTTDISTREAINRLIEAQVKQRMLANVSQEYVFRVVDPAVMPDMIDKVSPKKMLMTIGGALFGLMVSICFVLLLNANRSLDASGTRQI